MTIQIHADGVQIPVTHIKFSDGGSNLKLEIPEGLEPKLYVNISVDPTTPVDAVLFEVLMARDAVHAAWRDSKQFRKCKLNLHLPYLPHGRADRRFEPGNAAPLQVFLEKTALRFNSIYLTDPHSGFYESVQGNFMVKHQAECFAETNVPVYASDILVAPDKGAMGKIQVLADKLGGQTVLRADKKRDISNGRVLSVELPNDIQIEGRGCIIVDDICDGGGTFLPLAQALLDRGASTVELYVTHGIFAKGLEPFRGLISKLHVYQIVSNYVSRADIDAFNSTIFEV